MDDMNENDESFMDFRENIRLHLQLLIFIKSFRRQNLMRSPN